MTQPQEATDLVGMSASDRTSHARILAAEVLAAGGTQADAALAAQVSSRTIHRWQSAGLDVEIRRARSRLTAGVAGCLVNASVLAARTLTEVMDDHEQPTAVRVRAAAITLQSALTWHQVEELEARMVALERALGPS